MRPVSLSFLRSLVAACSLRSEGSFRCFELICDNIWILPFCFALLPRNALLRQAPSDPLGMCIPSSPLLDLCFAAFCRTPLVLTRTCSRTLQNSELASWNVPGQNKFKHSLVELISGAQLFPKSVCYHPCRLRRLQAQPISSCPAHLII